MVATAAPSAALVVVPKKLELVRPVAPAAEIMQARAELLDIIPKVLVRHTDFGTIPGTNKECLYKAGAERVCGIFGAHPEYEITEKEIDHDRKNTFRSSWVDSDEPQPKNWREIKEKGVGRNKNKGTKENPEWVWQVRGEGLSESVGLYRYVVRCRIVRQDGLVLGESFGSCSTLEGKYIDRPRDCENTALKMAQKRAFVGAALNAFGLSDRFTADVDDVAGEVHGKDRNDDGVVEGEIIGEEKKPAPAGTQPTAAERLKSAASDAKKQVADKEAAEKKLVEERKANAFKWAQGYVKRLDAAKNENEVLAVIDSVDLETDCATCKAKKGAQCEGGKPHDGRGVRVLLKQVDPELLSGIVAYETMTFSGFSGGVDLTDEDKLYLTAFKARLDHAKAGT
jgi:hypothetical protein